MMDEQRPWHRLFGLSWTDFFRGLPVTVDSEKDLSLRKQLLDVVLIRKEAGTLDCRLPDGFENLATYNLVSFKSHQEKLSAWTLEELLGHYVNLRKQVSPSMDEADLLAREDFRLYAVTARFPPTLAADNVAMRALQEGVYEVEALTQRIRVVVVNQLPREEHNALLHLFSASAELFAYGARHYRIRSAETSSLLLQLFQRYREEDLTMPDKLEEFTRETIDHLLKELPVEKRLEGVPAEKRLEGVPAEKRLEGLSAEKRLEGLSPEEMLAALSPEIREALARLLKGKGSDANAK
jgi:hypothetical protein